MLHAPPNQKGITMRLVVGRYTNLRVRGRSIFRKRSRYPSHQLESLEPTNPATLQLHPVPLSTLPPSTPLPPWLQNVKSYRFWEVSFHPPGKVNHHHICQVTQVRQWLEKITPSQAPVGVNSWNRSGNLQGSATGRGRGQILLDSTSLGELTIRLWPSSDTFSHLWTVSRYNNPWRRVKCLNSYEWYIWQGKKYQKDSKGIPSKGLPEGN